MANSWAASSNTTIANGTSNSSKTLAGIALHEQTKTGDLGIIEVTLADVEGSKLKGSMQESSMLFGGGTGQTQDLQCLKDIAGNGGVVGSCVEFIYHVYQLKPSNDFTKELFAQADTSTGLVTARWPNPASVSRQEEKTKLATYRLQNQELLNSIDPNSTPWKITYVVTFQRYATDPNAPPTSAAKTAVAANKADAIGATGASSGTAAASQQTSAAPASTLELPAALKAKLEAAGMVRSGLMVLAYDAVYDPNAIVRAGAKNALINAKLPNGSTAAVDSSKALAVMQSLAPGEKTQVGAYLDAQSKLAAEQFAKARDAAAAAQK